MEKEELLEQLKNKTNCMIISDLKFVKKDILYTAVKSLNSDDFSIEEWCDAIMYLTDRSVDDNITKTDAKEFLCDFYRS
ncbi:MAG: hypothetical protein ACLR9T_11145 [Thomasclavelia sp.]|uniref:hypothetical protein n=1 Tax=Thomasclavelia sp. TaxID=3025757 RepID=UPI0039A329C0